MSSLTSSPIFLISGFAIGFLSFIGMIFFYFKSKKEKVPYYHQSSTNIFNDLNEKFKSLQVTYANAPIKSMTVTRISFWNAGKEDIRKGDIAPTAPLTVKVKKECQILDVKVFNPKNTPNNIMYKLSKDLSLFHFCFDYLEKNEGVIFQILHTGKSDEDIELIGKIIGAKEINKLYAEILPTSQLPNVISNHIKNPTHLRIINHIYNFGLITVLIIIDVSLILNYSNIVRTVPFEFMYFAKIGMIFFILFLTLFVFLMIILIPMSMTEQKPEGFDSNFDVTFE